MTTRRLCERSVAIVGCPPRLALEEPETAAAAAADLVTAFAGGPRARRSEQQRPSPVRFGGLPIAEREFVDALLAHGTWERYCLLARDACAAAGLRREFSRHEHDPRFLVCCANDLTAAPIGHAIVHAACSDAFAGIETRERMFPEHTPVHLFLSGLSDPYIVVPSVQLLLASSREYDCLTALSASNRIAAERLFEHVARGYETRWHIRPACAARLTGGGLGIDVAAFRRDETIRHALREQLGIAAETPVFLYVGRLGPAYKADVFPLVCAFARLFADADRPAMLVLAGYDEGIADRVASVAAAMHASSRIKVIADVTSVQKRMLYSLADVFVSPSDSTQEALGLTLVEAMAAGLPVIASDWNGYRESVEDGVTGFLVQTYANPHSRAAIARFGVVDLMDQHLLSAQNVCIDTAGLIAAMQLLATDSALRERMGRQAAEAAARHDWSRVVAALEDSWDESLRIAAAHRDAASDQRATALYRLDPFEIYRHYPTGWYADHHVVSCARGPYAWRDAEDVSAAMNILEMPCWETRVWRVIHQSIAAHGSMTIAGAVAEIARTAALDSERARFYLFRMVKYGALDVRVD